MAGLRIGYAIASEALIRRLEDVKNSINSYTMNMTAIEIGRASLAEEDYFRKIIGKIKATRERLTRELAGLGFRTLPSGANFIFTTHESVPAKDIFEKLRERHIFVRYFAKKGIDNYLRISVGTDEETDKLIAAMREITQKAI